MKMHLSRCLFKMLFLVVPFLFSCNVTAGIMPVASQTSNTPLQTNTATLTPVKTQEVVLSITPSPTKTFLPQPTLDPTQAADSINQYLQEPMDCDAPCFLGIVPGKTTYAEAAAIFNHLGLKTWTIVDGDQTNFGNDKYLPESGLELYLHLVIYNEAVRWFTVGIHPEKQQEEIQREWSLFSPETLIRRYGRPTKVQFFMDRGGPPPQQFNMDMYFDAVDLIVTYISYRSDIRDTIHFCPSKDQFSYIRVYLGEDPENPPLEASSLEDVSGLTLSEFSEILTSDIDDGCVDINTDVFP